MKTNRFNLSAIMSEAWNIYRCTFFHCPTFSEALKRAWENAKKDAARKESEDKKAAEAIILSSTFNRNSKESFYSKFGKTIAREYKHVSFGKNDYRVSYGNRYNSSYIHY